MKKLLILAGALALAGCDTVPLAYYATSEKMAQYAAEEAKANAALAEKAGPMGQGFYLGMLASKSGGAQQIAPPRSPVADLLQFAGIVLPAAIQGYGIRQQTQLGMRQSDNGARQGIAAAEYAYKGLDSTNGAFTAIAGKIQAAGAVTTIGDITSTRTANPVTTTSTANPVSVNTNTTTSTANPVTTTTSSNNPATTTANPVTDSHNVAPLAQP